MKLLSILLIACALPFSIHWENDFSKAKTTAADEHKLILLNFSGSDWCGPCIRMHKEFFDSPEFTAYANEHLIMVNADFPRQKKNQLPKTLQQQNDQLAEKYNSAGNFPFTVLLTADGRVLRAWNGFPKGNVGEFISELKQSADAGK